MEINNDVLAFSKLLSSSVMSSDKIRELGEVNWNFIYTCAVKNDVLTLLLPAFRLAKGDALCNPVAIEKQAKIDAYKETKKVVCAAKLLNELRRNGIKAVVLKGIAYKSLYPYPELRKMSDMDLLILDSDLEKVYEIACGIGEVTDNGEVHHFTIDRTLNVETTNTLYPDRENALFEEYDLNEDITENNICEFDFYSDRFYTLTPTQNALYCTYHMFKHFIFGGIGARQMCDFALLVSKFSEEIDWSLLFEKSKKAKMKRFLFSLLRISDVYFGVDVSSAYKASDEKVDDGTVNEIWCDMLDGGVFGVSTQERELSRSIVFRKVRDRNNGVKHSALRAVFPSLSYMKKEFEYVKRCPLLLPVGWVHRVCKFLFLRVFKAKKFDVISKARRNAEERLKIMDKLDI